jgi:hypothetical protein
MQSSPNLRFANFDYEVACSFHDRVTPAFIFRLCALQYWSCIHSDFGHNQVLAAHFALSFRIGYGTIYSLLQNLPSSHVAVLELQECLLNR